MYKKYWGLKELPFQNVVDLRFLYKSEEFIEAYSRLEYCIKNRKGGAVIIGEYGSGKSTLCKFLVEDLKEDPEYIPILISYSLLSPKEFLFEIYNQKNKRDLASDIGTLELVKAIEKDVLLKSKEEGQHPVVIIDEAHLIKKLEVFEQLRLLLNFQSEHEFLLTLIFIGQKPLVDKINQVKQLKQRLAIRYLIGHLKKEEVEKYIKLRLSVAGREDEIFEKSAIDTIVFYSKCIPRNINNICDMALLIGSYKKVEKIDSEIIKESYRELEIF